MVGNRLKSKWREIKKIAQMVAVLDLENAVNFDRHTSVLAPYCNCWEAPSAKSDLFLPKAPLEFPLVRARGNS